MRGRNSRLSDPIGTHREIKSFSPAPVTRFRDIVYLRCVLEGVMNVIIFSGSVTVLMAG